MPLNGKVILKQLKSQKSIIKLSFIKPMKNIRSAIQLSDLCFSWGNSANDFNFKLNNFVLPVNTSGIILGSSGSGKSTLLGIISGIIKPNVGVIKVLGEDLFKMTGSQRDRFRADNIGIIFQQFNLIPYLSTLENVLLPLRLSLKRRISCGSSKEQYIYEAKKLLDALGVSSKKFGNQLASTLSVGQQQRVAAARAFIGSPPLIIADEPTSSLDEISETDFLKQLFKQTSTNKTTLLLVSHNKKIIPKFNKSFEITDIIQSTLSQKI